MTASVPYANLEVSATNTHTYKYIISLGCFIYVLHYVDSKQCVPRFDRILPTEHKATSSNTARPSPSVSPLSSHIRSCFTPKQCSLGKTINRVNRRKQDYILTLSRHPDVTEHDTWRGEKVTRLVKETGVPQMEDTRTQKRTPPDGDDGHMAEAWPSGSGGRSGRPAGNCPFRFLRPADEWWSRWSHMMRLTLRRQIKCG